MRSLQEFIIAITQFIGNVILPFLFGLALFFFVWNVVKFLIIGGADKDARVNARNLALYSIGAFVFLVSLWGIVNLITGGLNFGPNNYVMPDIIEQDAEYMWWHRDSARF